MDISSAKEFHERLTEFCEFYSSLGIVTVLCVCLFLSVNCCLLSVFWARRGFVFIVYALNKCQNIWFFSYKNKKAQPSLTNPRDAKACQNCSNSTCRRAYNVVADNIGLSSCVQLLLRLKSAKSREIHWKFKLTEFKVIQGHQYWCQSKAHMWLAISHNSNFSRICYRFWDIHG